MILNSSLVISGASPRLGSSHSSSFGRLISARAIGEHLLLAARQAPRSLTAPLGQPGERLVPQVDVEADLTVLAGVGADPQVVLDGQLRERAAALGHLGDAQADDAAPAPSW